MILTLEEYKELVGISNTADDQVEAIITIINSYVLQYTNRSETDDLTANEKSSLKLIIMQLVNTTLATLIRGAADVVTDNVGANITTPINNGNIKSYTFEGNSVEYLTGVDIAKAKQSALAVLTDSLKLLNDYRKIGWETWET